MATGYFRIGPSIWESSPLAAARARSGWATEEELDRLGDNAQARYNKNLARRIAAGYYGDNIPEMIGGGGGLWRPTPTPYRPGYLDRLHTRQPTQNQSPSRIRYVPNPSFIPERGGRGSQRNRPSRVRPEFRGSAPDRIQNAFHIQRFGGGDRGRINDLRFRERDSGRGRRRRNEPRYDYQNRQDRRDIRARARAGYGDRRVRDNVGGDRYQYDPRDTNRDRQVGIWERIKGAGGGLFGRARPNDPRDTNNDGKVSLWERAKGGWGGAFGADRGRQPPIDPRRPGAKPVPDRSAYDDLIYEDIDEQRDRLDRQYDWQMGMWRDQRERQGWRDELFDDFLLRQEELEAEREARMQAGLDRWREREAGVRDQFAADREDAISRFDRGADALRGQWRSALHPENIKGRWEATYAGERKALEGIRGQQDALMQEVASAPSTVGEQARQAYAGQMAAQASAAALMGRGVGGGGTQAFRNLGANQWGNILGQTAAARSKENISRMGLRAGILGDQADISARLAGLGRFDASLGQNLGTTQLRGLALDQQLLNTGTQLRTNWAQNMANLGQNLAGQEMGFTNLLQNQLNRAIGERQTALNYGMQSDQLGLRSDLGFGALGNQTLGLHNNLLGQQIRWEGLQKADAINQGQLGLGMDRFLFDQQRHDDALRAIEQQNRDERSSQLWDIAGGAIKGGVTGFATGGPKGALIGAIGGGANSAFGGGGQPQQPSIASLMQQPRSSGFEYQSQPLDWSGFNSQQSWQNTLNNRPSTLWSSAGGF